VSARIARHNRHGLQLLPATPANIMPLLAMRPMVDVLEFTPFRQALIRLAGIVI
jgi:hypothetical protein